MAVPGVMIMHLIMLMWCASGLAIISSGTRRQLPAEGTTLFHTDLEVEGKPRPPDTTQISRAPQEVDFVKLAKLVCKNAGHGKHHSHGIVPKHMGWPARAVSNLHLPHVSLGFGDDFTTSGGIVHHGGHKFVLMRACFDNEQEGCEYFVRSYADEIIAHDEHEFVWSRFIKEIEELNKGDMDNSMISTESDLTEGMNKSIISTEKDLTEGTDNSIISTESDSTETIDSSVNLTGNNSTEGANSSMISTQNNSTEVMGGSMREAGNDSTEDTNSSMIMKLKHSSEGKETLKTSRRATVCALGGGRILETEHSVLVFGYSTHLRAVPGSNEATAAIVANHYKGTKIVEWTDTGY